jgi:hypothetical protein
MPKAIRRQYFFLFYFPSFEKMKVDVSDHLAVCVSVCVSPPIVAGQRPSKYVPAATNSHGTIEELLDSSISMLSVPYGRNVGD